MSTHAYICKETTPGKYLGVRVNLDGYPSHVGALLLDYYNTPESVDKLLSNGNISSLKEKLDPNPNYRHDKEHRQAGVTVYFGRDCGENNPAGVFIGGEGEGKPDFTKPQNITVNQMTSMLAPDYTYVFLLNERWVVLQLGDGAENFEPLEAVVAEWFGYRDRPFGEYGTYDEDGERIPSEEDCIYWFK